MNRHFPIHLLLAGFTVCALCGFNWVDPVYKKTEKGNDLYTKESYDEAHTAYVDAQIEAPQSYELSYNIGDALYKQGKFDKAIEEFDKVEYSGDAKLEAKAAYNAGNAYYRMGQNDQEKMLQDWQSAIDSYEKALKKDPDLKDAKYNIELVRKKVKELMDQQKQNQDQNQQNQDQKDQQNQPQQDKQQSQQNDQQKDQQQQGDQNQDQQQNNQQDQQQQGEGESTPTPAAQPSEGNEQNQDQEQQNQQEGEPKEAQQISPEEAARILDALADQERDLDQMPLRLPAGQRRPEVDW